MLVHARKYRTEDKLKLHTQTKLNPEKSKQHSKTKLSWFSHLYDTPPGNKVVFFYNSDEPTQGAVPNLIAYLHLTT